MIPLKTLICQKPGIFLRLSKARNTANARHMCFDPFGPRCFPMNSFTDGRVARLATAALTVAMPATALRRVTADISSQCC